MSSLPTKGGSVKFDPNPLSLPKNISWKPAPPIRPQKMKGNHTLNLFQIVIKIVAPVRTPTYPPFPPSCKDNCNVLK